MTHADEQYLARKKLKELPQAIERLEVRLLELTEDLTTLRGNDRTTVAGQPMTEASLGRTLNALPEKTDRPQRFPLGTYRGLAFGIERDPGGRADVYLEGRAFRRTALSRDAQGPRAVSNALGRLADTYPEQCESLRKEKALAENQLRDYRAWQGLPFAHSSYLEELTGLRDRLKLALSSTPAEGEPTSVEIAAQIDALKATNAVEATVAGRRDHDRRKVSIQPLNEMLRDRNAPEQKASALAAFLPYFLSLASPGAQLPRFTAGLRQSCTDIIRFRHGASSSWKTYSRSFIPGLHDACIVFERPA